MKEEGETWKVDDGRRMEERGRVEEGGGWKAEDGKWRMEDGRKSWRSDCPPSVSEPTRDSPPEIKTGNFPDHRRTGHRQFR